MQKSKRSGLARAGILFLLLGLIALGFAFAGAHRNVRSEAVPLLPTDASAVERGAAAFLGHGFGGISQHSLDSNAIPWKLAAAALVLREKARYPDAKADLETLRTILKRFGFLYPEALSGMPESIDLALDAKPLGMTHGTISPVGGTKVEVANLGCAACHSGVAYDSRGMPEPSRAVPGMPNTSLDLESYTQAIFVAMRDHGEGPQLLAMADTLFPDMDWRERMSLRWLVLPLAKSRLSELEGHDRPLPFPNGLPGATNGVAALKMQTGTPLMGGGAKDRGFVSIPELALRDRRNRLLADGAYAAPSGQNNAGELAAITSFFTVPSMGVKPEEARRHISQAEDIFAWLADYRPLRFPGAVDETKARRGAAIYASECASCHGSFEWKSDVPTLVSFTDWIGDVGTDRLRAEVFDNALAEAVGASDYSNMIMVRTGEGYAAPPLAGLWASAPYLHNGSVPTLEELLDPPARRARFMVGGHALDFEKVGLRLTSEGRFPDGYTPFSTPKWVDTTQAGLGNRGHSYGAELSDQERQALIEFLKLL